MGEENMEGLQQSAEQQEREFWKSVIECPHSARLGNIGNELDKVRKYANEYQVDDQLSQAICFMTASAYYAGVSPLIRVEQTLNLARGICNEYAFALATRSYIEVGGRVHKGIRLWRVFESDKTQIEQFHAGVVRLLGRHTPDGKERLSMFKTKGFNVMSFVKSFKDQLPEIEKVYDTLSAYVHGGYEEQRIFRLQSWWAHLKGEQNPLIREYSDYLDRLRQIVFSDFDVLLALTKHFRERYDAKHKQG